MRSLLRCDVQKHFALECHGALRASGSVPSRHPNLTRKKGRDLLSTVQREPEGRGVSGLKKNSLWFTLGTLLSRFTGLVRETVVLATFGASAVMDSFFIAFRIPNLLRDLLAEGALGQSFTKVYVETADKDPARAKHVLGSGVVAVGLLMTVVSVLGIGLAPYLVRVLTIAAANGRGDDWIHITISLTQIMFPYLGLAAVGAVLMGALHQARRFFSSAVASVLFNLGMILGALYLSYLPGVWNDPRQLNDMGWLAKPDIQGLAWGVILGGVLNVLWLASALWGVALSQVRWGRVQLWTREWSQVCRLMLPMIVAAAAAQVSVLINSNFATFLETGAVTWLSAAFRLVQLPVGLFAVGIGAAVLPELSKSLIRQSPQPESASKRLLDRPTTLILEQSLSFVLWLTLPATLFLLVASHECVDLIFGWKNFSDQDVLMTSRALHGYSWAIAGYGLIKVLTSFYYAVNRTQYAMRVGLVSIVVTLLGNLSLTLYGGFGVVGLAWTTSLSLSHNALWLLIGLQRHQPQWCWARLRSEALWLMGALLFAWGFLVGLDLGFEMQSELHAFVSRLFDQEESASVGLRKLSLLLWLSVQALVVALPVFLAYRLRDKRL